MQRLSLGIRLRFAMLGIAFQVCAANAAPAEVLRITNQRQLFVDDWIVEAMQNIQRKQGTVVKSTGNPILVRDKAWDAGRCDIYGSGVFNPATNQLQIFYSAVSLSSGHDDKLAFAVSNDMGATWRKPDLGLISFGANSDTNLLLNPVPASGYFAGPSVFLDEHETDPNKQYKMFDSEYYAGVSMSRVGNFNFTTGPSVGSAGMYVAYSPDGIHWTRPSTTPVSNLISDTTQSVFWDARLGKYVAYVRAWPGQHRAVGRMESADFVEWSEPQMVLNTERQIYSMGVTPYEDIYIGTLWIFDAAATGNTPVIWPELAVSRDGTAWSQPFAGRPLISTGAPGSADSLQIRMSSSLVVLDDKIVLIYGQTNRGHVADMRVDVGMATMRLDGFAALVAGDTEGWILTKLLQAMPGRLMVNADVASGGYVKAEIVGQDGEVLSGYELETCAAITGDSIKAPLAWKAKADMPEQKPLRLRFILRKAKLYSFWVESTPKDAEPANASGTATVCHDRSALMAPHNKTKGQTLTYGLGQIFQEGSRWRDTDTPDRLLYPGGCLVGKSSAALGVILYICL